MTNEMIERTIGRVESALESHADGEWVGRDACRNAAESLGRKDRIAAAMLRWQARELGLAGASTETTTVVFQVREDLYAYEARSDCEGYEDEGAIVEWLDARHPDYA